MNIKQIINSVHDIIFIIDPAEKKIIDANNTARILYGLSEDISGTDFLPFSKYPDKETDAIQNSILSDNKIIFESVHKIKNNDEVTLDVNILPIEYLNKKVIIYSAREKVFEQKTRDKFTQSEYRFRSLYENNPLITFTINADGKIISLNNSATKELNYSETELSGEHISKIYHPDDEQLMNFQISNCLRNPNLPFTWELRLITKAGKTLWVRVSSIAIKSPDNGEEIIVVCDNVTHQKETEKTLIDYAKSLQQMIDASPLGVLVYTLDEQNSLRLISTNKSAEKLLGIDSEGYLYKKIEEIFPALSRQLVINNFIKIAKDGGSLLFQKIRYNDKNISGTYEYSAIQLAENTVAIFFTNITQRENALELLQESESKYKTLFESSHDAILILKNEYFVEANQKALEIFGCELNDILNKTPFDFSPEFQEEGISSRTAALQKIDAALKGTPQFFEWKHKRKDSTIFDADVKLFVIEIKGEKFVQAIVRDITEKKKVQKQIAMFANAFQNISESVIIGDMQDNIIFVNDAFTRTYGFSKEEIIGKNVNLIRSKKNPSHIINNILPATLKGGWKGELFNIKKTGEEIIISLSTSPIYDENGKLIALCGIVDDITERKKMLEQLSESEERFRSLVNNLAESVIILDWNGKILFANQRAAELVELDSPEKGVGRSITEFLHPSDIDRAIRLITFDRDSDKRRTEKYRVITANKNLKWVESISSRIKFQNQYALLSTLRDITERVKTEELLHLLTNALHNAANGILITDLDGKIIWINDAIKKLSGFEEEELIGKPTSIFKSGLLTEEFYKDMWETIIAGNVWKGELINKRKNGSLYDEEMVITPIMNENNQITNFIAVKQDITSRKKSERELREAKEKAEEINRLKSSFLANVSHELRTPLVGILGFSELLRDNINDKEMAQMAERIFVSGKRLLETLNSILDLSRIESNKLELKQDNINVCRVVRENIMQFEALAKNKNLYLKADIEEDEIITFLDDRILHQILNNLVNNAIKFTPKGGVTISVTKENKDESEFVVIKVSDTGIGISEENLPLIFEEFRQVSEGLDRKFEGTGLGLTLTKKFVEVMGGTITVKSKQNEGTSFIVKFPINIKEDSLSSDQGKDIFVSKRKITNPISQKSEILLVENDPASIEVTKLFLSENNNIDVAKNADEALNMINHKNYELILMDINLGKGLSGIDIAKIIRQKNGYEKIPIVAITAYAMAGDKEDFLKAGCTHYLSKPFKKDELLSIVEEALSVNRS